MNYSIQALLFAIIIQDFLILLVLFLTGKLFLFDQQNSMIAQLDGFMSTETSCQ